MKNLKLSFFTLAALLLVNGAEASSGYVIDTKGQVVRGGYGECVQTSGWSKALAIPECDKALAAKLKAEELAKQKAEAEAARRSAAEMAKVASANAPAARAFTPAPRAVEESKSFSGAANFPFGQGSLTAAARSQLDAVVEQIATFSSIESIVISGHTDSEGSRAVNERLSATRAEAAKRYLEAQGVNASITIEADGESDPVASNSNASGRAANRRVDIVVTGTL